MRGVGSDRSVLKGARLAVLAAASLVALPSLAAAHTVSTDPVDIAMGVLTLAAAVFLLVVAYGLGRVAEGSALADNIRWVMLAAICIAGNVLVVWVSRFISDPTSTMAMSLASDGLMILGIVFLCVYFYRVRAAMLRFVNFAKSSEEMLAQIQVDPGPEDAPSSPEPPEGPSEPPAPGATA